LIGCGDTALKINEFSRPIKKAAQNDARLFAGQGPF